MRLSITLSITLSSHFAVLYLLNTYKYRLGQRFIMIK